MQRHLESPAVRGQNSMRQKTKFSQPTLLTCTQDLICSRVW